MNEDSSKIPDFLVESCHTLGLTEREKIRQLLQCLFAATPETSLPAESLPVPLEGIRDWSWQVVSRHKFDMDRLSVAMWFTSKLSLWKPKYKSLEHYYTDGCGFSAAQGERHCHHGNVLVALVLGGIPASPTEKQARAIRKIVPQHLVAEFFTDFLAHYDPSLQQNAGATKRAAVRFAQNKILAARKNPTLEETSAADDVLIQNAAEEDDDTAQGKAPPQEPAVSDTEDTKHSDICEIQNLLKIIAPAVGFDQFVLWCVDSEFKRLKQAVDEPQIKPTPLLDALTAQSTRYRKALEILFQPRIEAFLKHLLERESQALLKGKVGVELSPPTAEPPAETPPELDVVKKPRKKRADKSRVIDPELEPELPFGPLDSQPDGGAGDVQAASPNSLAAENDNPSTT
ncbi:hypothetical protein BH09VER1_BH09VER1_53250 [soil metagenome]